MIVLIASTLANITSDTLKHISTLFVQKALVHFACIHNFQNDKKEPDRIIMHMFVFISKSNSVTQHDKLKSMTYMQAHAHSVTDHKPSP